MNRPLVFGGFAVLVAAVAVGWIVINQSETLDPQTPEVSAEATAQPSAALESANVDSTGVEPTVAEARIPEAGIPEAVETEPALTPEIVGAVLDSAGTAAEGAVAALPEAVEEAAKETIVPVDEVVTEAVEGAVSAVTEAAEAIGGGAAALLRRPADGISADEAPGELTEGVAESAAEAVAALPEAADVVIEAVEDNADQTVDAVEDALETAVAALPEAADGVIETVEDSADQAVEDALDTQVAALPDDDGVAVEAVEKAADEAVEAVEGALGTDLAAVPETTPAVEGPVVNEEASGLSAALDGLSDGVAAVGSAVSNAAEAAATAVTETARDLAETAREGLADLAGDGPEETELAEAGAAGDEAAPVVLPDLTGSSEITAVPAEAAPEVASPGAAGEQLAAVPEAVPEIAVPETVQSEAAALPAADAASVAPVIDAAKLPEVVQPEVVQPQVVARIPDVEPEDADEATDVPTFDVVRVDRTGGVVIAGRSGPSCTIEVQDGEQIVGTTQSNLRGEWVVVPDAPLAPGSRELGLRSICGSVEALSDRLIVVVVPERGQDIAGRVSDDADGGALALSVPRTGGGQTEVLQAPEAPSGEAAGTEVAAGGTADAAAIALTALSVDVVDYSDKGDLELAGRAEAGAALRLYLDNDSIGVTAAGDDSRWALTPQDPVAPGLYTLRVDQVARDGSVTARVELPFLRGEPLESLPDDRIVVVQPGNSLWRIARRTYGDGVAFTLIFGANADQIRDPDLIYPGQIFTLPVVN